MPKNITTEWGPAKVSVSCNLPASDGTEEKNNINIELSVHSVGSISYIRELQAVFPGWDFPNKQATVIATMQNSSIDLVGIGSALETEKDSLLERFVIVAKQICTALENKGYRADFIDPCSGLPGVYLDGNTVFNEVQSAQVLLGYKMMNVGCCKVILHPEWDSAVYPASIITLAPPDEAIKIIEEISTH